MDINRDELIARLLVLDEAVWEKRLRLHDYERWLANFYGKNYAQEVEQLEALFLLSHFIYVTRDNIQELMRSAYRDLLVYPRKQRIRDGLNQTRDALAVETALQCEMDQVYYFGVGGPSSSGTHLLYDFGHACNLPKDAFVEKSVLLSDLRSGRFKDPALTVVYIDDIVATGEQVVAQERKNIDDFRSAASDAGVEFRAEYLTLFGTSSALERVSNQQPFDFASSVHLLDHPQEAFHASSRIYVNSPPNVSLIRAHQVALTYGYQLEGRDPLGIGQLGLMIGFEHNVPDNSLPIIWSEGSPSGLAWNPIFPRSGRT